MPGTLTDHGLTPRVTEWVPELLAEIHTYTERTIRTHTTSEDPWRASSTLLTSTPQGWQGPSEHSGWRCAAIESDDNQPVTPRSHD